MFQYLRSRMKLPRRHRLNRISLSIIILLTLAVSYYISYDRTRGTQKRLDRAVACLSSGQYEESLELYDKVLSRWPRAKIALVGKGLCLLYTGQFEEALASYGEILENDSDNLPGLQGEGMCYEKLGRINDAILSYRKIQLLDPDAFEAGRHIERLTRLQNTPR